MVRTVDIHADDATLDLDDLDAALGPPTRLVAVGYASNAIGTINPVADDRRGGRTRPARWTYVDAVAYAPHGPIDVQALDTDFLVSSAYKWYGPHAGALYGKREHPRRRCRPTRSAGPRPVRDRHPELRGDRRRPRPRSSTSRRSATLGRRGAAALHARGRGSLGRDGRRSGPTRRPSTGG